jgi:hypothetical protein
MPSHCNGHLADLRLVQHLPGHSRIETVAGLIEWLAEDATPSEM